MRIAFFLLSLITAGQGVKYCPTCISFDYSQSTMTREMKNAIPEDVDGQAHCDNPSMMACDSDDMMCNTAELSLSLSISTYKFHNILATEKGCMEAGATCLQIENLFESIFDADDSSGISMNVDSCDLSLCDENGKNCVSNSGSGDPQEEITTCPFCMSFDYSAATNLEQHQKNALPTDVDGVASCNYPETIACANSNMKCHTVAIRLSMYRNYGGRVDNIQLIEKGCSEPSHTCKAYEKTFEAAWGQQSASNNMNLDIKACAIELCGTDGGNCTTDKYPYYYNIPASEPDTGAGTYITVSAILALGSLFWTLLG